MVVATISGAPPDVFPTTTQSLSSEQLIALYCPVAVLGGVCVLHVGLVDAAFAVSMIVPAEVVPPTAKQWLASGHDTPYSVLVVGDVSGPAHVMASAAGAAISTPAPIAAATRIFTRSHSASRRHAADRSQLEAGPRRRRPNSAPTTIPPNPTSAIGHHGIVLPPEDGRASTAGTVLLTSFAPSDALPCSTWRGPQPVAVIDAL